MNFELPTILQRHLKGYGWQRVAIGESGADVFRLFAPNRPELFLKIQRRDPLFSLRGEAERLRWLEGRAPVPGVVDFVEDATQDYLLMAALPGKDAATVELAPESLVILLAESLRQLHAVDIDGCPFAYPATSLIELAKAKLDAGEVDVDDFDPDNQGRAAEDILSEIIATQPANEDAMFTHGDYCLPNIMVQDGRLSGFIDLGTAGVGDPYRDLALVARSLLHNLGSGWLERFFEVYGLSNPDRGKLRFYRLIDEFF